MHSKIDTLCKKHVSVKCGGREDLNKHVETKLYRQIAQTVQTTSPMTLFVTTDSDTEVTKAEMLFTHFLIEHTLPVAVSDHARPLFRQMFGDSKAAAKYGCGQSKTTAIKKCLAEQHPPLELVHTL